MTYPSSRRTFLKSTAASMAGVGLLGAAQQQTDAADITDTARKTTKSPNEQIVLGWIGCGIRFHNLIGIGSQFGPAAAVCDVDMIQCGRAVEAARHQHWKNKYPIAIDYCEDYRRVIERNDIDAVVIATPDHWHTKIAIEAMQAGKDVYCEKPLTLTIREGRQIAEAEAATGRVLQVGTMQRTEFDRRFATAAALVQAGRIGKVKRVTCAIGGSPPAVQIPKAEVPSVLNWDMWLGQASYTDYRESAEYRHTEGYGAGHKNSRTHKYFRWWYEYSGGKLTDWGAHHVDIAMWALNKDRVGIGQYTIDPLEFEHPVSFDSHGMPTQDDRYNTATSFNLRVTFADGVELDIRNAANDKGFGNGIMFEGEKGRFFVNRGKLTGKPIEDLEANPLPADALKAVYGGRLPANSHMHDFADAIRLGVKPVSDVESHQRVMTVCHAANIAMRLGRKLTVDPVTESFVGDQQANSFVERMQRKGYEINWPTHA